MTIATRQATCSQCGKTERWGPGWRHGEDPLGPYLSEVLTMRFCGRDCEVKAMAKIERERKVG